MIYYQLEYDKCLNGDGTIFYKEKMELLSGIGMDIRYSPVFRIEENKEPFEQRIFVDGEYKTLNSLLTVSFNNQEKNFHFTLDNRVKKQVSFQLSGFHKDVSQNVVGQLTDEQQELVSKRKFYGYAESQLIDSEEFFFLKDTYGNLFENDNNLQNCAYSWHEIKLFKEYEELELDSSYFVYHTDRQEIVVATFSEDGQEGRVWTIDDTDGIESLDINDLTPVSEKRVEKEFKYFG